MIVLFIASTTQAMATVVMPYQMTMGEQGIANQNHCAMMNSEYTMTDIEPDNMASCGEEHDCCSGICSLSYISTAVVLAGAKPVQESIQGIENRVIATTNTLFRPPILG